LQPVEIVVRARVRPLASVMVASLPVGVYVKLSTGSLRVESRGLRQQPIQRVIGIVVVLVVESSRV